MQYRIVQFKNMSTVCSFRLFVVTSKKYERQSHTGDTKGRPNGHPPASACRLDGGTETEHAYIYFLRLPNVMLQALTSVCQRKNQKYAKIKKWTAPK